MSRSYTARFERGDDGWWVVSIDELPGCHTQARTLEQGRARIREALSLHIGDAARDVELEVKPSLPAPARHAVARARRDRARAEAAELAAAEATERAVAALLELGLSTRDAGTLLGLTRQRVHQLASAPERNPSRESANRV